MVSASSAAALIGFRFSSSYKIWYWPGLSPSGRIENESGRICLSRIPSPRSQSWGRAPVLICPNAAFGPTRTKIMGDAFECAIALFKVAPSQMVREAMANRIIAAAHHGVRDMDQLVDAALVGTGLTREAASVGGLVTASGRI
jgi:hypothetical protein